MRGHALQKRRLRKWTENPHCAICGKLTQYPGGFELDHIVPLFKGGQDVESNTQILCSWIDENGERQGCHVEKSNEER